MSTALKVATRWAPALCLILFTTAAINSLVRESATFDETAHLPAGLSYLQRGDFRLNAEHPPLSKLWAALPLWIAGTPVDYEQPSWSPRTSEWAFGYAMLRHDPMKLLVPARIMMVLLGVLLGWLVFVWSRGLWGDRGGLLTLFLYSLSPTILAHTRLVTTDLAAALGFAAALWSFWRFCRGPNWPRVLVFAGALALALLTKFSTLLLGPILVLLGAGWLAWPDPAGLSRRERARWLALAGVGACVAGYVGLWAGYGFRFDAAWVPDDPMNWDIVGLTKGPAARVVRTAIEGHWLPEGYLYGLAYALGGAASRLAYLNGEQSIIGWWYYFPEAFLLKTPLATLGMCGWLGFEALRRRAWAARDPWFLVLPAVVYVAISITGNLNIGHRHLLPLYPLLFVALGALGATRTVRSRAVLGTLLAAYLLSFAWTTPRYLSFFNLLAGGPQGGSRFLLDSNLDWGQDLPRLSAWMRSNGVDEIDLAYFGSADPAAHGIAYRKIHRVHDFEPSTPAVPIEPGRYLAVSLNLLHGLYLDQDRTLAELLLRHGLVERDSIQDWLDMREQRRSSGLRHPDLGHWLVEQGRVDPTRLAEIEAETLAGQLTRIRREQRPIARAGDSIAIYRLTVSP